MSPSIAAFKLSSAMTSANLQKDGGLKIDTDLVVQEELDGRDRVVGSEKISGAAVADPDEFQRLLHGVDLNRVSGSGFIVIKAAVRHKKGFRFRILTTSTTYPCTKSRKP